MTSDTEPRGALLRVCHKVGLSLFAGPSRRGPGILKLSFFKLHVLCSWVANHPLWIVACFSWFRAAHMYIARYLHMNTHMYLKKHVGMYWYTYVCICIFPIHVYAYTYVCACVCVSLSIHAYVPKGMFKSTQVHIYIYIYIFFIICKYMYTHTCKRTQHVDTRLVLPVGVDLALAGRSLGLSPEIYSKSLW